MNKNNYKFYKTDGTNGSVWLDNSKNDYRLIDLLKDIADGKIKERN